MKSTNSIKGSLSTAAVAVLALCANSRADMVTDWSANLDQTIQAVAQPVPTQARSIAIVHVAIYDAVNGIAGKYAPYFVTESAPPGARPEAAAAMAAYTVMVNLIPPKRRSWTVSWPFRSRTLPGTTARINRSRTG
jgi:hypothetical protein